MKVDALRMALVAGLLVAMPVGLLSLALHRRLTRAVWFQAFATALVVASQFMLLWSRWRIETAEPASNGLTVSLVTLGAFALLLLGLSITLGSGISIVILSVVGKPERRDDADAHDEHEKKEWLRDG